jgi:hypothetical protein
MNKKTLYISIGVVALIAIGVGIFFLLKPSVNTPPSTIDTPFGTGDGQIISGNSAENPNLAGQANQPVSGLQKISSAPISGATIFIRASTTVVRYMDKATGNIFEFDTSSNSNTRVSNTTLPKISEVVWGVNGNTLFARSIRDNSLQTFAGSIATSSDASTEGRLEGGYLQTPATAFVSSPNKAETFYLENNSEGTAGFLANSFGREERALWSFPAREWVISWPKEETIFLNTKASALSEGFLYALNTRTGGLSPVISHVQGLTSLVSPNGENILYSDSSNNSFSFNLYDVKNRVNQFIPFSTMPEKCVWVNTVRFVCGAPKEAMGGDLPDSWYKGAVSFNDSLRTWDVFVFAGEGQETSNAGFFDIKNASNVDVDAVNLQVSPDGTMLIFENKKDFSLWILPLSSLQ